ncbi:MAG: phosphoenolpyruvate carboxykinase (ATP) [Anaerolineales bacterium]|nr:phosphoenolpyruvate carboxykinase (ATP) [Anaerolineales bacterium]
MTVQTHALEALNLSGTQQHWNVSPPITIELALARGEGALSAGGNFVAITSPFTGRSPDDKWTVKEPGSEGKVWWGKANRPIDPEHYQALLQDVKAYLDTKDLIVRDLYACADPAHRLRVRLVSESAWHTLFANNLFIRPTREELATFEPNFTILHAPEFNPDPDRHGIRRPASGPTAAVVLDYASNTILIAGTRYAGEIKKSIFTALNYLLPNAGVFPMHCSANIGPAGDTALFFGLSGTGKTTLSADPTRRLIGDDEHGWSDDGVFNFEGGCYAKVIRLSAEAEPEIYATLSRFGTVLENVVMDPETRELDLASDAITENTRAAYPIDFIANHEPTGRGGHPENVVFLTADAFGVLPPIGRLTPEQAMYHFLSGYTAKLAGTERGVTTPQATFSACFGAVFLAHHPSVYAELLRERINRHQSTVWLVNTGWSGGPAGIGQRMKIAHTRAMVRALLNGSLRDVPTEPDPVFGVHVPVSCPGVPPDVLKPRNTWANQDAYDRQARDLAQRLSANFQQFAGTVDPKVVSAGPATS